MIFFMWIEPRIRRPQFGVKITLPAEFHEIHTNPGQTHAFGQQSSLLLSKRLAARRKCKPTICAQNTMPGQSSLFASLTQYATNKAGATRQASAFCNFPVTAHAAARNFLDGGVNGNVFRLRHDLR